MAIEVTLLGSLMGRFTNKVVNEQANEATPLMKSGTIKKLVKKDKLGVVNISAGEMSGVSFLADGGTLPRGGDSLPVQGTYFLRPLFGRVKIPRLAAEMCQSSEDAVDIVEEQLRVCGQTMGRMLARAMIGSQIGTPAASVSAGDTTFTVADPSPWRNGMNFEVWDGSTAVEGTTEATLLRVTKVAIPVDGVGTTTITFTGSGAGAGSAIAWTTSYTFNLRGSKTTNATMVSLADIASASASLYGVAATGNEWFGVADATAQPVTVGAWRSFLTTIIRRRGEAPSHIFMNRKNLERYSNQMINQRRFVDASTVDPVGKKLPEFEGIPIVTDENIGDAEVFFFNDKDIKLHVGREFAADFDGANKKKMDMSAALISDSEFVYDLQVWGAFNMRAERRNGLGYLSNVTA